MSVQLDFSRQEQNDIGFAMTQIAGILFEKMDEGVTEPCVAGTYEVVNEDKIIEYTIAAKRKL